MIVDLFIPCYVDRFFPQTALKIADVLEQQGCSVHYPVDQTCCGMPPLFDGFQDSCKDAGTNLIRLFQNDRYVVSCGTVCSAVIRCHYNDLFHNSALHNEYKHLQKNLYEFSTFMTRVLNVSKINTTFKGRAVFIGGCAGTHGCISHDPSLQLLQSVKGLELISLPDTSCCGWGGTLARNDEKKSVEMALDLIHQIQSAGAGLIISNEPGCLMHLMMVMKKKGIHIETRYIAEFF